MNIVLNDTYTSLCCQPTGHDQLAGWGMVSFASFIFIYYTVWVIVLVSVASENDQDSVALICDHIDPSLSTMI